MRHGCVTRAGTGARPCGVVIGRNVVALDLIRAIAIVATRSTPHATPLHHGVLLRHVSAL